MRVRGVAGRRTHEGHRHRIRHARIAQTRTLLAETPSQSVKTDPSFSPPADSFCCAVRGRCKCSTNPREGVLAGKHHFLFGLMGSGRNHPVRPCSTAPGSKKNCLRGQLLARVWLAAACRLWISVDSACSRHAALPLRDACSDGWDPSVHASRPLLRPRLTYVSVICKKLV